MAGRLLRFEDCSLAIRSYCETRGLDFAKAKSMAKSFGQDVLFLQYHDASKGKEGLYNETRMPVVLQVERSSTGFLITETENTKKYLGIEPSQPS